MNKMKWHGLLVIGIICALVQMAAYNFFEASKSYAATVTTGVTFTTNQTVQYYHLNNAVNNATVSDIVTGDITDGTIATVDLANNAVTTGKVLDENLTGADILNRSITINDYGTNTVDETALNTNITFRPGFLTFSNGVTTIFSTNQIQAVGVTGTTNRTSSADEGGIVKLGPAGFIHSSMLSNVVSIVSTNLVGKDVALTAHVYSTLTSLATTATTGKVLVKASVANDDPSGTAQFIRLRASDDSAQSSAIFVTGSASPVMNCQLIDVLTGSAKTYLLEVSASGSATENYTNTLSSADTAAPAANCFFIQIIQIP